MTNIEIPKQVVLRRKPDGTVYGEKRYAVVVDGQEVGDVYQVMVTHDTKPRGSRIVTRRTQSLRWVRTGQSLRLWTNTRWEAIYRFLRDDLGLDWSDAERLAQSAKVEKGTS